MAFENATPRPWAVRFDHDFENLEIVAPDDGKPGRRVVCEGDDTERTQHDFELIVTAVNAHADLQAALKRAADMLHAVAGDLEDGYSLDTLRGKYVMAVLGARDAAYAALKLARAET